MSGLPPVAMQVLEWPVLSPGTVVMSGSDLQLKAKSRSMALLQSGSELTSPCRGLESGQSSETILVSESHAVAGVILIWVT